MAKEETKENFCGACVAGVAALVGSGTAVSTRKNGKKTKKIIFWISVSVTVVSILIMVYLLFIKKCDACSQ